MNKHRYVNHVNEPTILRLHDQMKNGDFLHVPVHDVIISNCTNLIQNLSVENGIGNSDHGAVIFEMNLIKSVPSSELSYDYRNADWEKVRCTFKEIHSLNKIDLDNPQELLNNLIFVIKETEKQSFVLKPKRLNLKCQWDSKRI